MVQELVLHAGVSRRIITPPRGIFLIGYGDRAKGNTGVHDDLTATALVLEDGAVCLAIVALDVLALNEFVVDRVRARLDPTEVLLCCSHTHSGPIAYAGKGSPRKNRAYIDALVEAIVAAVRQAGSQTVPVRLEYACGQAGIAINRRERMPDGHFEIGRNPQGEVDRSVQVVSVIPLTPSPLPPPPSGVLRFASQGEGLGVREGPGGRERLATLVNFASHGTVLGPDNLLVSADWIGAMRERVEDGLGGLALFLQGAAANLNPDMYWDDARAFEMVAEEGRSVAEAVLTAARLGSEELRGLPLGIERSEVWLPTESRVTSPHPPRNYSKPLLALARLPGWMACLADPLLNQRYPWKSRIEARGGYWSVPMRVSAVRIGELAVAAFAAETFTEIGLAVKADSPARHTLFASLTDGCVSYLHTESAHAEGGYEVDVAPLAYRFPGRLSAVCERITRDAVHVALKKLWENK
jgi:neutral ceramidase